MVREIDEELGCIIDPQTVTPMPTLIDSSSIIEGIPRFTLVYQRTVSQTVTPSNQELTFEWVSKSEFSSLNLAPNIAALREQILALI